MDARRQKADSSAGVWPARRRPTSRRSLPRARGAWPRASLQLVCPDCADLVPAPPGSVRGHTAGIPPSTLPREASGALWMHPTSRRGGALTLPTVSRKHSRCSPKDTMTRDWVQRAASGLCGFRAVKHGVNAEGAAPRPPSAPSPSPKAPPSYLVREDGGRDRTSDPRAPEGRNQSASLFPTLVRQKASAAHPFPV